MTASLPKLEQFVRLLHEVQRVKRVARRPDERELTNTAEHTFNLAMTCWYIVATNRLNLDLGRVLMFALAHDIIEAYAGDTLPYDVEAVKTKAAREAAALVRIEAEFGEFNELANVIHAYELREEPEARFVYAVDKLVDPLDASMETTQSIWKEYQITWDMMVNHKRPKVALSDIVGEYWKQLEEKLEGKKDFYFDAQDAS